MMFFVAPSTHRPPEIPLPHTRLLRKLSARVNKLWVVPSGFRDLTRSFLGRFSDYRQRPGNGWCGRSGDGYTCPSLSKFFKRACIAIKFDFVPRLLRIRGPPRYKWLVESLGCGVWHSTGLRISLRLGGESPELSKRDILSFPVPSFMSFTLLFNTQTRTSHSDVIIIRCGT